MNKELTSHKLYGNKILIKLFLSYSTPKQQIDKILKYIMLQENIR